MLVSAYNYEEEIKACNFKNVANLLRDGDLSRLSQGARNLLADYLDGKLKRMRGAPRNEFEHEIAMCFYGDYRLLRTYSRTGQEISQYSANIEGDITSYRDNMRAIEQPMDHQQAIEALKTRNYLGKQMGFKNVERLVTLGGKLESYYDDCNDDNAYA